jgi:hypothetical protein
MIPIPVCCDMTSLTRIAYGSRVFRQGRSRPFWLNQAKRSSSTAESLDERLNGSNPETQRLGLPGQVVGNRSRLHGPFQGRTHGDDPVPDALSAFGGWLSAAVEAQNRPAEREGTPIARGFLVSRKRPRARRA